MPSKSERLRRSVVVIGLGRFGQSLALELMAGGAEVLGIDSDERVLQNLAGRLTHVVAADSTDELAMRRVSAHEFHRAVVGIGNDVEASILTTAILRDFGIGSIWARAVSGAHAKILTKIGAHHVVRPEHDTGRRVAHLVRGRMQDFIEFDGGYAIVKSTPPSFLWALPLSRSAPRSRYGVTIVGVKRREGGFIHATPRTVIQRDDLIIVSGERDQVERFSNME